MAVWGGMPDYITKLFSGQSKDAAPPPETMAAPGAPTPQRGMGDRIGRGLASFLGFVPEGGYDRSPEQGVANFARALLGYKPGRQANEDYLQLTREDQLRKALETGNVDEIAKLDPKTANEVFTLGEDRGAAERNAKVREALAAGDLETLKGLNPDIYAKVVNQQNAEEEARRAKIGRFANVARNISDSMGPEKAAAFLEQEVARNPKMLNEQERAIFDAGGADALVAAMGGEGRNYTRQLVDKTGEYILLDPQGNQLPTGIFQDRRLQDAQIEAQRALAAQRKAKAGGKKGEDGEVSGFDMRANSIVQNLIDLDNMGALSREGQPSMEALIDNPVGRTVGGAIGNEAALKFNQIDAAQKAMVRDFAKAAGIGVGSINSNFELQNVMDALSGGQGYISRMAAMEAVTAQYGGGTDILAPYVASGDISPADYEEIKKVAGTYSRQLTNGVQQVKSGGGDVVTVQTPEEAMALPPGTVFMTPDGRRKVR